MSSQLPPDYIAQQLLSSVECMPSVHPYVSVTSQPGGVTDALSARLTLNTEMSYSLAAAGFITAV